MQAEMQPRQSRAIFSTQDFHLLRVAVAERVRTCKDPAESIKYANLLHRLGRAGG